MMQPPSTATSPPSTTPPSVGRFLVVDDEQSTCELLEVMLRRQGVEVEWRTSAYDAIDLVAERDFDVILTDLGMAGMGGIGLCEHLRDVLPDVPVVVVTGEATMTAAVAAFRAGAYDFLTKPIDAKMLSLSCSRALHHSRQHREAKPRRQQSPRRPRP
jgi:two-component system, NtrC family, response regulator HydG